MSRKRQLLEEQQEGKKRISGWSVGIPPEAFMTILESGD